MSSDKPAQRGATNMRARGMKLVQIWLDKQEAELIVAVARKLRTPLARWVRQQAVWAASKAAKKCR